MLVISRLGANLFLRDDRGVRYRLGQDLILVKDETVSRNSNGTVF